MRVVVFDPGGRTGYCLAHVAPDSIEILRYGHFQESDYISELVRLADLVICEKVTVHASSHGFNTVGIEVMGVVKYFCKEYDTKLTWQNPSCMKAPVAWKTVDPREFNSEHPKDAVLHLAYWLVSSGRISQVSGWRLSVVNSQLEIMT